MTKGSEPMRNLWPVPLCACVCALFSTVAFSQSAERTARITGPINENQLVTLSGHSNPLAIPANDRGAVDSNLPMAGLSLVLSRSAAQQAAFDAFVAGQYDQNSPSFHQWLSPQQVGQRFGPAQVDIHTISGWLSGHGFTVKSVSADHMSIQFSGTAGQVQSAFHAPIHNIYARGRYHVANMSDPRIPAALGPLVIGVKGLHNFLPHPLHRVGSKVQFDASAHGWIKLQDAPVASLAAGGVPALSPVGKKKPSFSLNPNDCDYDCSNSSSANALEEDVAPFDFAAIYNLPSGWPTNSAVNGTGQIITIIGTSDIDLSDAASFKSFFGLPTGLAPIIANGPDGDPGICSNSNNVCGPGDLDENSLDVEWSGAMAPGAQVVLVTDAYNDQSNPTNDPLFDGAQWAIDNSYVQGSKVYGSRILSLSYGECELFSGTASNVAYYNLWQTAASAGIAVFVATGDSGSPSCDQGGDADGNPYEAQYGLSVNGLGSTPFNTAVGGTDFSWCQPTIIQSGSNQGYVQGCSSSNASAYWNTTTNSSSPYQSANGYVPEIPWNDSCLNPINATYLESLATYVGGGTYSTPEEACTFVYNYSLQLYFQYGDPPLMPYIDTVGGSGGASNCVVNTSTSAAIGSCTSGSSSTGSSYGNLALFNNGWPQPAWQAAAQSLGVPADGVRHIPDISFFAGDGSLDSASLICVSNDGASCPSKYLQGGGTAEEVGGTSVATPAMAGVMALINQKAGTAQGSPNAELYHLAAANNYSNNGPCSSENAKNSGSGCYFHDIDQGTNSMPCVALSGTLEGGAVYAGGGVWDRYGTAPGAISPNCSIVNTGDVVGTLSGFAAANGYDQATGLGSLNIANVVNGWTVSTPTNTTTDTVSVSLGGVSSITTAQSLNVTVTVSSASGTPSGSINLLASLAGSQSYYETAQNLSSGGASFTIPASTFASTGTVTLTAGYSGDTTYAPNVGSTTVTVTGTSSTGAFTLNSIASPAAVTAGTSASTNATVVASGGYAGTVTLSCALTTSPSGATNLPTCAPGGTVALSASSTSGSAKLNISTTATTIQTNLKKPSDRSSLLPASGGALLALLVFFGIPARRRSWRAMLGALALIVAFGSLSACGSGGGSSGTTTTTIPGTTAGTYTFTVTAKGSPAISTTPSQTFTLTVN